MKYFPLLYRLHAEERYLLWISNEHDSVEVGADGFVPSFRDLTILSQYTDLNHLDIENGEPVLHDLKWIATWRMAPVAPVDCVIALNAWNLFGDVAMSVPSRGIAFRNLANSQVARPIYDKLFWGNNLRAMTPKHKRYVPEWLQDERQSLANVMTAGLELFASCVRSWPLEP
jgi:hypothetical protein